jgi:hypothetical protein
MPGSVAGVIDDWNPNDPDATRVLYDLSAWTFDQQAELAAELADAEIPHTWDGGELVVPQAAEAAADQVINSVEARLGVTYGDEAESETDDLVTGDAAPADRIDVGDELPTTEYDLIEWPAVDRDTVSRAFAVQAVPFRWEGDTLLVHTSDEAVVESLLDLVEAGEFGAVELDVEDEAEEEGDELPFETLTTFFLAGERLRKNPLDADGLEQLIAATELADPAEPPYGVDRRLWERTCELADELAGALVDNDQPDDDRAIELAESLHALLRPYV